MREIDSGPDMIQCYLFIVWQDQTAVNQSETHPHSVTGSDLRAEFTASLGIIECPVGGKKRPKITHQVALANAQPHNIRGRSSEQKREYRHLCQRPQAERSHSMPISRCVRCATESDCPRGESEPRHSRRCTLHSLSVLSGETFMPIA
jgi:hypothetical protein